MKSPPAHPRSALAAALAAGSVLLAACSSASTPQAASSTATTVQATTTTTSSPSSPSTTAVRKKSTTTTTLLKSSPPTTAVGVQHPSKSCSVPPLRAPAGGLVVGRVTAIGDSVMIDLEPYLTEDVKGISFDAVVGQQWSAGIAEAQALRAGGQLGSIVVIELGTNGPISTQLFIQMMEALRGVSRVVFVTNYVPDSWEMPNNSIIEQDARHYDNAAVANWFALASANPGWLCPDGYHLSCGGPGAAALASLIADCV